MFNSLLLFSFLAYVCAGLIAAVLSACCKPKRSTLAFFASAIIGTIAAFITTVLFKPDFGPAIAGIYLFPAILAAVATLLIVECISCRYNRSPANDKNVVDFRLRNHHDRAA